MIRILLADDHAILRKGLIEILTRDLPGVACSEAENADTLVEQVRNHDWDLVILDITMPGRSGLDALRDLKRMRPKLRVLVLSMHSEEQYGRLVLRAGASGFMNKESAPQELIGAIHKVLGGSRYLSATLAETMAFEALDNTNGPPHEKLSGREFEVLRMIAEGKPVGRIAEDLHLSVTTVSTHRAHILGKMGMSATAELMHYALSNHLVE